MMQLQLFQELIAPDVEALAHCKRAAVVALDVETETRWPGYGPRQDYGLSYPAEVTVIALAWRDEAGQLCSTALSAPFDTLVRAFLLELSLTSATLVAHNAVFDLRQISKLTNGQIPLRIWDTQSMARLLHPAVNASYNLVAVAGALDIPVPEQQVTMKSQRGQLHRQPLTATLAYAQADAELALLIYEKQQTLPADPDLVNWEYRAI